MKAHQPPLMTLEACWEEEKSSGRRHEFHDGLVYALAGGTVNHGLLCGNIYAELRAELHAASSNCKPTTSEIKLHILAKNTYVYPDAMVICYAFETSPDDVNAFTNPALIVEVLSKSTSDDDRGDKFHLYRQIPSLQECVLIEQDHPQVDVFFKPADTDLWRISRHEGLETSVPLQSLCIDVEIVF